MVSVLLAIFVVGILPLFTAAACALFIAAGAAKPNTTTQRFEPAPYQPMAILTHSRHA